jgi:cytochrome c5
MKKQFRTAIATSGLILTASAALFAAGCHSVGTREGHPANSAQSGKGGSQLWAENCMRCHNVRSPSSYSDAEWEVAMHHMRIRANLTAEEHEKILEFLKSAN